jgi:hypothetical protein
MGVGTAIAAAVIILVQMPGGRMRELAEQRAVKYGENLEPGEVVPSISM